MAGVQGFEGFYAHLDTMPGPDGNDELRIGGTVVFTEGGWSVRLERHEPSGPIGINPFLLTVDMVFDPPEGPTTKPISSVELDELCISRPALQYNQVQFRTVGYDGPPRPPVIDVTPVS